jgi:hypothetical protein
MYETPDIRNFYASLAEFQIDLVATTIGDFASGIGNYYAYTQLNGAAFSFDNLKALYFSDRSAFPNMSATDLLEDIDAYLIAQLLKANSSMTFYDAFVSYYTGGVRTALSDYFPQGNDDGWTFIVNLTLTNGQVLEIVKKGASDVLVKHETAIYKPFYDKAITNTFLYTASAGFVEFLKDIYRSVRK